MPILTYHSLDQSGSVISMAPAAFREQMRLLAARGFVGIGLGQLLDAWGGRATLPARPVVLTFDDGYSSFIEHAAPTLTELGFGATIFVVAGLCGQGNDWSNQPSGIPRLSLLSWADLARLAGAGIEVGSHTMTHPRLPRMRPQDARREIVDSKRVLEDRLGVAVQTFAYPFGLIDRESLETVRAHYLGACSTVMGLAGPGDDRHRLRRLDAYYLRPPAAFRLFGTLPGRAYLGLRARGNDLRALLVRCGVLTSPY